MTPEYAVYKFREIAQECAVSQEPLQQRLAGALQKLSPVGDSDFPTVDLRERWTKAREEIRTAADMDRPRPRITCSDFDARRLLSEILSLGVALERWTAVNEFILHNRVSE